MVVSPQPSPQREVVVQYALASTGADAPISDADKEGEGGHHGDERPEADSLVTPPSTTIPESSSLARIPTDEPVRSGDAPARGTASSQATATDVAGEETITPQQTHTGNPPFLLSTFLPLSASSFLSS